MPSIDALEDNQRARMLRWRGRPAARIGGCWRPSRSTFRENSKHRVERFGYGEASPQLLLQRFLSRILNSEARVEREYDPGRLHTDLLLAWTVAGNDAGPSRRKTVVIECKLLCGNVAETLGKGVSQTLSCRDRVGAEEYQRGLGRLTGRGISTHCL